jgi:ribosome maturation factor RimP
MGRGLIAEPEWVNKVQYGHEDDLRKCISCNIGCAGHRIGINRPIRCTVNPAVNKGADYIKKHINKPCNVVVIGGGTAGLEAACTAAEVGCTTFLLEKKPYLGGLAAEISKIPDKKRLSDFPNYLIHRAGKLKNLYTFTGTEANVDLVKNFKPDIIVNATGSNPLLPPIKGVDQYVDKEGGITIGDCELVSRALSDLLDQYDYISENYILEVSSPGLDRPLRKDKDFARSIGKEVELRLFKAVDKVKEFEGTLTAYDKETVTIQTEDFGEKTFRRKDISMIRLAFYFE